ncbi:hypothetical protein CRYUN_Cryun09bG0090500 [Craigia yunnanensis]
MGLSLLVITKCLTKTGNDYEVKAAHVELAERMRKALAAIPFFGHVLMTLMKKRK